MTDGDGTGEDALASFVRRTRHTLDAETDLSPANTDLRIVLPFLKTLGWDVHGPEVVADFEVVADDATPGADTPDARPAPDDGDDGESDADRSQPDGDGDADSTADADDPDPSGNGTRETVTVDYALTLDGRPSVFVVTAGTGTPLSTAHGRRLGAAMNAAAVDRGLVTNGRSFVFVAVDGEVQRTRCDLVDLPDRPSLLSLYSRESALARRRRRREADRRAVAETLRDRRETAVDRVETALTADLDSPVDDELAAAAEAVVDDAIDALAAGDHPAEAMGEGPPSDGDGHAASADRDAGGTPVGGTATDGSTTGAATDGTARADGEAPGDSGATAGGGGDGRAAASGAGPSGGGETTTAAEAGAEENGPEADTGATGESTSGAGRDASATEESGASTATETATDPRNEAAPMSRNDTAGEYVVRFFDEHSSVGAVGTATPGGAVAQAVSFLAERRALGNRLSFPWRPEDATHLDPSTAVVNREPVHPDGRPMADPHRVDSGYHVETDLSVAAAREVLETLAERTGLRVMFQGAW